MIQNSQDKHQALKAITQCLEMALLIKKKEVKFAVEDSKIVRDLNLICIQKQSEAKDRSKNMNNINEIDNEIYDS